MSGRAGEQASEQAGEQASEQASELSSEQMEYNTGGGGAEGAMDASTGLSDQDAPPAEVIAAARARAGEMLRGMTAEDEAGMKDLHNLTLSIGLPATRATFQFMVAAAGLRGAAKKSAMRAIAGLSPVTEIGCMKVDYFNRATGAPDTAYLVLDRCPRDHDLGAQLDKLKVLVPDEKWPEVIQSLSMMLHIGRSVYSHTSREQIGLIRTIRGAEASDPCAEYLDLKVDRANTTLYLEADWPERVGIHVQLGAEVATKVAAKAKTKGTGKA
jgi:hypothetical protein